MPKFEDKFVHFRWSGELEGKEVFCADDILTLTNDVTNNCEKGIVTFSGYEESPFRVSYDKSATVCSWRFVYYDPNYETKLAYEQGKKIECSCKCVSDAWNDWSYIPNPKWLDDCEYRIMQEEKPVTDRELAMWLSKGNGEFKIDDVPRCGYEYWYNEDEGDKPVSSILVRKWEDGEWHEPTREYLGL